MTRRSFIRAVSYMFFGLSVLVIYCIMATTNINNYKQQLEINYQQSLVELNECLETIETNLTKCMYSNSTGELYDLSRDIYSECATAKNAISRLPISQLQLQGTYKFLSQAGDYAIYMGDKLENNKQLTSSDQDNFNSLLNYAHSFTTATGDMIYIIEAGGKITENQVISTASQIDVSPLNSSFSSSEDAFDDYPTLLYDGPFADQVVNKKSVFLNDKKIKTKAQCQEIAAKALGVKSNQVTLSTDQNSNIECYNFKSGRYTISVCKKGGYVRSILSSEVVKEKQISVEDAIDYAENYLKKLGYDNMEESYYTINNNICTINFAYEVGDTIYYPDLIKIGVSMYNGVVMSLEATTYLMNHSNRADVQPKISEKQAQSAISPYLSVLDSQLCVIPEDNGQETACWEFRCKSEKTGEEALIYINAETKNEEEILLLTYSDNGILVK